MIATKVMGLGYDTEILRALEDAAADQTRPPPPPPGDWRALREFGNAGLAIRAHASPPDPNIRTRQAEVLADDGACLRLCWYRRRDESPGSAVLYIHGGGMILGSIELYEPVVAGYVASTGVPVLAVDYRLAPEHPHPRPVEDCYCALVWLVENGAELGVDPTRIAVMGDSAGGGLAAGVAQLARDREVAVAAQILVYPMLDDRTTVPDPLLSPFALWSYDHNLTAWTALLGDSRGAVDVPWSAAPARAQDLTGLPPTYVDVGDLDIFRDETIDYARRLALAGVPTELHVHPGAPHGFDRIAPDSAVARRAMNDRRRVMRNV